MVSGEGYIMVTFPPIPYCNPGPYSGHEVKIIYQSYRQDLETLRTAHHPVAATEYYRVHIYMDTSAWAVVHRSSGSPIIIPSHDCTT